MATTKIHRTFGTPTNLDKWTYSAWIKLGPVSTLGYIFECTTGASNFTAIKIDSTARLFFGNYNSGYLGQRDLTRLLRDPSAWYHIVAVWDSDNVTAGDRMKLYVNGVQETTYHGTTNPTSGEACQMASGADCWIGVHQSTNDYFSGEMSHVQFVDGSALAPTEFGEVDSTSGIWKIKTSCYATPGNNGFCLKMEDRTNLDLDSSSNAHTFTTTGTLTATYDNPSDNFCTLNPLAVATSNPITFGNGNNTGFFTSSAAWRATFGTLAPSSGKWYYECIGGNSSGHLHVAIASLKWANALGVNNEIGTTTSQPSYSIYGANGKIYYSNTSGAGNLSSYGSGFTESNYIGCYFDLDNNKLYFAIDGTIQNSGTGFDIQSDFEYLPALGLYYQTSAGTQCNFGNGSFGSTPLTGTTYSDVGGEGMFKYNPSTGTFDGASKDFRAICTKNIKAYGG